MKIEFEAYTREKYSVFHTPHGTSFKYLYIKFDLKLEMRNTTNVLSYAPT